MDRRPHALDYLSINSYWFALTARAQALSPLIIPLLVQQFIGEEAKGTFVGVIRLWALMTAVLVQALMGILSDRSRHPAGRRRPFIVAGALGELVILAALGLVPGLQGTMGYWVLFALYILSMFASNTAHAGTQALIPDLVPDAKKGLYSGVKALFELPLPMIFVSLVVGRLVARGDVGGGLAALGAAIVVCAVLALWAPEKPYRDPLPPLDWRPFIRLVAMTLAFTATILGSGAAVKGLVTLATRTGANTGQVAVAAIGVGGMLVAAVFGVWLSIRIGLGAAARGYRSFTWWVVNRLLCLVASTNLGQFMIYFSCRSAFLSWRACAPPDRPHWYSCSWGSSCSWWPSPAGGSPTGYPSGCSCSWRGSSPPWAPWWWCWSRTWRPSTRAVLWSGWAWASFTPPTGRWAWPSCRPTAPGNFWGYPTWRVPERAPSGPISGGRWPTA